jgi:AcrR family transcriptional regulator
MAQQPRKPLADRLFEAAMTLAATRSWRQIALAEIAAEAKVGLDDLYGVFPSKAAILARLAERADAAMLKGDREAAREAAGAPARERLLDVLMRRLDALEPHKDAVASIVRSAGGDPCAALCAGRGLARSMAWGLEAAGLSSSGLQGLVRARVLGAIYLSALLVWLRDDSADKGRTLAHLDRTLRRAERLAPRRPASGRGTAPA